MKVNCYVCDGPGLAGGNTCKASATADSAQTAQNKEGYTLVDDAIKKDFDQKVAGTAGLVKFTAYSRTPNLQGTFGRFNFAPQMTQNFWAAQSVVEYTFAATAFGTAAVCQVLDSAGAASDVISKCEVTGAKVKLTWGKDATSVNFNV